MASANTPISVSVSASAPVPAPVSASAASAPSQDAPVRSLQTMLNYIALFEPQLPRLSADGIFGERTLEAVMIFQRDHHLPVTGTVDIDTWTRIVQVYQQDQFQYGSPPPLSVLPCGSFKCCQGQRSAPVYVVQAMFNALCGVTDNFLPCIPASSGGSSSSSSNGDLNDGDVWHNLCTLQSLCGLPVNGTLDRSTWAFLSQLYAALITRCLPTGADG